MANLKITQLPTLLNVDMTNTSVIPVVSGSDSTSKKISIAQLDLRWASVAAAAACITQLTGDVVAGTGGGSQAATIQNNVVTNAKMAQMALRTIKGNNGDATANASDLTIQNMIDLLFKPPTVRTITATGAFTFGSSYYFTCSSANATAGAEYTNNGETFTVLETIAAGTQLLVSSTGAPAASGTLTKSSGTGDATITFSSVRAPIAMRVTLRAGGAGGAGNGSGGFNAGGTGGDTTFGALTANGGVGGAIVGGLGGTASGGNIANLRGAPGQGVIGNTSPAVTQNYGGSGGGDGGGQSGSNGANTTGGSAQANSGGGGAGSGTSASYMATAGGGQGGLCDHMYSYPAATYSGSVGVGGTGGANSGGGGCTGGDGGSGKVITIEYWQ